jgi:hypothetical protein
MWRPLRGAEALDIDKTMLDELTRECKTPQDVERLYSQMLQHMINRSLEAEMQAHLSHERHGRSSGNMRNGKSHKRAQSAVGELQIESPRDREGTFEPQLLPNGRTTDALMIRFFLIPTNNQFRSVAYAQAKSNSSAACDFAIV